MDPKAKHFLDSHLLSRIEDIKIKATDSDILIAMGLGHVTSQQSFLIKAGNRYEAFWNAVIKHCPNTSSLLIESNMITLPNGKNRQIDLFFKIQDKYYYYEMKCNLNFDSEKSPASVQKIIDVAETNKTKYNVQSDNFTYGYFNPAVRYVPQEIKDKAETIAIQHGVCDLINIIGEENMPFTAEDYFTYHSTVLKELVVNKLDL